MLLPERCGPLPVEKQDKEGAVLSAVEDLLVYFGSHVRVRVIV